MFAFRQTTPTRRTQQTPKAEAWVPKIFRPNQQQQEVENRDCDNSSVDMSLYTTQSKSTIRYNLGGAATSFDFDLQSLAPTEFTTEKRIKQHRLGGWESENDRSPKQEAFPPPLLTPATYNDESSVESYTDESPQKQAPSPTRSHSTNGPVKSRFVFNETTTQPNRKLADTATHSKKTKPRGRSAGPVDLDESIADSSSLLSSSIGSSYHSWVESHGGIEFSELFPPQEQEQGETGTFRSFSGQEGADAKSPQKRETSHRQTITSIQDEDESYVWADNEAGEEFEVLDVRPLNSRGSISRSQEDSEIINRSYAQTMESISISQRTPSDVSVWQRSTPGTLRLTKGELDRHLDKVQDTGPIPSSSIEGYDSWKQHQEYQRRYFAKLQKNVDRKKKSQDEDRHPSPQVGLERTRRTDHHLHASPARDRRHESARNNAMVDSTRSPMDRSMNSSTAEQITGSSERKKKEMPPNSGRARRWGLRSLFKSPRKSQTKDTPTMQAKNNRSMDSSEQKEPYAGGDDTVVSLSQFMRISADEPSEVAEFSVAPLLNMKPGVLGSAIPGGDTFAATSSHCLDTIEHEGSPKELALQYLEMERKKQRESKEEKEMEERLEQERIANLKAQELRRQRRLNNRAQPSWRGNEESSLGFPPMFSPPQEQCAIEIYDSYDSDSVEISFEEKKTSVSTKPSTDSSGSVSFLGPCVVCEIADRSHIAMPCGHYSFCGSCARDIHRRYGPNPSCPVCHAKNVVFCRVYTG